MVEKRNILIFIAISFGLSWPIVLILDTLWPTSIKIAYLSHSSAMMMPGLACVIIRKWISKEGFSDCGFIIGNRLAYLIVFLACFLLWGIPWLIDIVWGGGQIGDYSLRLIIITIAAFFWYLIPAFGEELGWRGFLQEHMNDRFGWLVTSLLIGVIWAVWHLPLWMIDSPHAQIAPLLFASHVMLYSVIIGAAYTVSGGSILPAILLHLTFNLSSNLAVFAGFRDPNAWFNTSLLPYTILAALAVLLVFLRTGQIGLRL